MAQSKENRIAAYLRERGISAPPIPLRGDASLRSFYRIPYRSCTAVLMVYDEPEVGASDSFLDVGAHLAACGVAVPEVYDFDREAGVFLLEDCGDCTLQERLRGADEGCSRGFYRRAIDELLKIHLAATCIRRPCVAFERAFDEGKFMEELDFFIRHTVEGLWGGRLSSGEREAVRNGFAMLSGRLAGLPRVFTHRDYHSRNLMVAGMRLMVVDFQDARMGPCQYDLASLLRDSYTMLPEPLRMEMVDCYLRGSAERGVAWSDREEFLRRLDLMSIQRNLKACGTFGYMATVRGDRRYLEYLPATIAYVRQNAAKFDFIGECAGIILRRVPA